MKLEISCDSRDSAILVGDEHLNDIAEFYHSDHATVDTSYESALTLAKQLVAVVNGLAQTPPSGWKLVPVEPTDAMVEVGCDNNPTQWNEGTDNSFAADVANDVYVSMVRSAPAAPQQSPRLERDAAIKECAAIVEKRMVGWTLTQNGVARENECVEILEAILALLSPDTTVVSSTSRCGASDAPEEVTGAEMDAIEAAAIAGNPLTTNDYELAGWARQWHWNDCAGDQPVDPSIYFRDMRMLKAFIQKCQSVTSKDPRHE